MNGIHDMGGMHGFGAIDPSGEYAFNDDWERRVFGVTVLCLMGGLCNVDTFRFFIEDVPPRDYLNHSYFERWLRSIERALIEAGILAQQRATPARQGRITAGAAIPALGADALWREFTHASHSRQVLREPRRFELGCRIRTINAHPRGHTRLPAYARGRVGTIDRYCGAFRFPDKYQREHPQSEHVYSVRFEGQEIWGAQAEPNCPVFLDIYESYIDGIAP